jgi:hypothetical protein
VLERVVRDYEGNLVSNASAHTQQIRGTRLTLSLPSPATAPFPLILPNAGKSSPPRELSSRSPFDCPCPPAVPGADNPGGGPGGGIPPGNCP